MFKCLKSSFSIIQIAYLKFLRENIIHIFTNISVSYKINCYFANNDIDIEMDELENIKTAS